MKRARESRCRVSCERGVVVRVKPRLSGLSHAGNLRFAINVTRRLARRQGTRSYRMIADLLEFRCHACVHRHRRVARRPRRRCVCPRAPPIWRWSPMALAMACAAPVYQTVPQVVIYDDEPGVVIRRWWLPPWRDRHYYPHGRASLRAGSRIPNGARAPRRARGRATCATGPTNRPPRHRSSAPA